MSQSPSPKPRQHSNINDSSVKGQVGQAGRDLWQFQFLFGRQTPNAQQERQNRQALIDKVRNFWVRGVLEKSLHIRAVIELNLEKRLDIVEQPFNMDWATPDRLRRSLPTGTKVIDLFSQMGEGATLLILGEPGSGKTMTLLGLARDLLDRAEQDETQPIPVVFNLSSWRDDKQTIADWLVQELREKYQVPKALSKTWIKNEQLLLLLDGLDEVRADERNSCVRALNQFIQECGKTETVVCSRIKDYEALSERLKFQSAIFLKPLTTDQVNQYLTKAEEGLTGVRTAIQGDSILQELVKTPLMLSVITVTFEGILAQDLPQVSSREEYLEYLFNAYIERMLFRRQSVNKKYTKKQTKQWLSWLARSMFQYSQSIFLIEKMQPEQLKNKTQKIIYRIGSRLAWNLIAGITWGLLSPPGYKLIIGLSVGLAGILSSFTWGLIVSWLVLPLSLGLSGMLSPAQAIYIYMGISLVNGPEFGYGDIKLTETLRFSISLKKIRNNLILGLFISFIIGSILVLGDGIIRVFNSDITINFLRDSLYFLICFVLPGGFFFGLLMFIPDWISDNQGSALESKTIPNEGIWKSATNGVLAGLLLGLPSAVLGGIVASLAGAAFSGGLFGGLIAGLMGGLIPGWTSLGGKACIEHLTLRLIMYRSGFIPWNYARFLDYATERIFIQKVGGGYIFIHRLLLEHFAEMELRKLEG
jgi:DNA polymerase III delta prime subunit